MLLIVQAVAAEAAVVVATDVVMAVVNLKVAVAAIRRALAVDATKNYI